MEDFLKPFLEKGVTYSLGKVPVYIDEAPETIIKRLRKVIFRHDVLVEFKETFHSACSPEPFTVKNDLIKEVINRLSVLLLSDKDIGIKTDVFSYVFQSFAASCNGEEIVHVIEFFIVLSHILGVDTVPNVDNNEVKDDCRCFINAENFQSAFQVDAPISSPESFIIFKELLVHLSKSSVNMNLPELQPYNKWFQQLLKNLAHSQPFRGIFLEIFLTVSDIDFKLLEGNLDYVFCNILAQRVPVDETFWDSYGTFLESALNFCAKFHRVVKFITRFLSSVKVTSTVLCNETILPSNVTNEFSKIIKMASNQESLSILDVLIENINECFSAISQNDSGYQSLLFVTSELLICFFKEVKLYSPSIALTTLQALIDKLYVFKSSLQKLGDYLFSDKTFISKNKEIVEMFLQLCFYCGEIQTLIDCYRDSVFQPSDVSVSTDYDWQCCISLKQWEKLVNLVLKSKLKICGPVCFQLALQNLRISKLKNETSPKDESTVKILLHQITSNIANFDIFEQLPPEDVPILLEILTREQIELTSKSILKQILGNEKRGKWSTWLSDGSLQESSVFTAGLFSEILTETGSLLREVTPEKNHPRLSWLTEEYFDDGGFIRGENLERLPESVNDLLRNCRKIRKSVGMNAEQRDSLIRLVEVFKLLPLPHMANDFRKLGLSFAVGVGTFLKGEESSVFDSMCNFLASDMDASTCFDIGLCVTWLGELPTTEPGVKVIESLVRNSPNMKFGLNQMGAMIESANAGKHGSPLKMLETRVVLYNELGKCWQRAKKRKSDNDLIGSYRTKLAKMITDEAKQLEADDINPGNCKMLLKIFVIELNKAIRANDEEEIANLAKTKFPPYFDFAMKKLKMGFDDSSAAFLTVLLQSMPQIRKLLPEGSFLKMWKALRFHGKVNWRLFCTNSTEEEFGEVLTDLLRMSKKFLTSESDKHSSNCFEIWVSFLESGTGPKKDSCQIQLQELFSHVHECHLLLRDLPIKRKLSLIKFFSFCLTNKEVIVTSHVLDTVIQVILECLDESASTEDFHGLFAAEAEVASAILLRQFAWSKSKVHLTFVVFKRLLNSLTRRCSAGQTVDKDDVIKLSASAFCLEKWSTLVVKKEKDFARTSAYFITALVSSIASVTVPPPVKFHLVNCINHFLSISDSHTIAYLMRILKPGYQQVFNTVHNQFKKYHKYSGKI